MRIILRALGLGGEVKTPPHDPDEEENAAEVYANISNRKNLSRESIMALARDKLSKAERDRARAEHMDDEALRQKICDDAEAEEQLAKQLIEGDLGFIEALNIEIGISRADTREARGNDPDAPNS